MSSESGSECSSNLLNKTQENEEQSQFSNQEPTSSKIKLKTSEPKNEPPQFKSEPSSPTINVEMKDETTENFKSKFKSVASYDLKAGCGLRDGEPFCIPDLKQHTPDHYRGPEFRKRVLEKCELYYNSTANLNLLEQLDDPIKPKSITKDNKEIESILAAASNRSVKSSKLKQQIPLRCDLCSLCKICPGASQKKKCGACRDCPRCTPWHVSQALRQKHPASKLSSALPHQAAVLQHNGKLGKKRLREKRNKIENIVKKLDKLSTPQNAEILQMAHPSVQRVLQRFDVPTKEKPDIPLFGNHLKENNILLLYTLLKWSGYEDQKIIFDVLEGFDIVGAKTPESPCNLWDLNPDYEKDLEDAKTVEDIFNNMNDLNDEAIRRAERTDPKMASALWDETCKDISRGIMFGPFHSTEEVEQFLQKQAPESVPPTPPEFKLLSPRFPNKAWRPKLDEDGKITLVEKIRPIDDTKWSLNPTHSSPDKLRLPSVRSVCCQANIAAELQPPNEDDDPLQAWASDESCAFRTCPSNPNQYRYLITSQLHPVTKKPVFSVMAAMIFGMSPSVTAYNRRSEALVWLCRVFSVATEKYVDDFWSIERRSTIESGYRLFKTLAFCIGCQMEHTKDQTPNDEVTLLGVKFDLVNQKVGFTELKRKQRIQQIQEVLDTGILPFAAAESLTGRVQWCDFLVSLIPEDRSENWTFRLCMNILRAHFQNKNSKSTSVSEELRRSLLVLQRAIEHSKDKDFEIIKGDPGRPTLVYTDGSEEDNFSGIGSIIIQRNTNSPELTHWIVTMGQMLRSELEQFEHYQDRTRQIVMIELSALYKTVKNNRKHLENRFIIVYIDNQAAWAMLCKAQGKQIDQNHMVSKILQLFEDYGSRPYFQFCPTGMNPSDDPSRPDFQEDTEKGMQYFYNDPAFSIKSHELHQF